MTGDFHIREARILPHMIFAIRFKHDQDALGTYLEYLGR